MKMRLIDADKGLISKIQRKTGCNFITAQEIVDSMSTVEERKVSKWIGEKGYPICEKCCCNVYEKYISCSDYAEITTKMDYCPNCGANMRGNENE
jgi:hypothetical protein